MAVSGQRRFGYNHTHVAECIKAHKCGCMVEVPKVAQYIKSHTPRCARCDASSRSIFWLDEKSTRPSNILPKKLGKITSFMHFYDDMKSSRIHLFLKEIERLHSITVLKLWCATLCTVRFCQRNLTVA